jgi:hypothetical protein
MTQIDKENLEALALSCDAKTTEALMMLRAALDAAEAEKRAAVAAAYRKSLVEVRAQKDVCQQRDVWRHRR